MTADNNNNDANSVTFSPETKASESSLAEQSLTAIEEGVPPASSRRIFRHSESSRLSLISKQYDIRGEGHLDETEQKMRSMDRHGRGYLSNEQVYHILQDQSRMQQALLTAKRLLILFAVLLLILAVANIGEFY